MNRMIALSFLFVLFTGAVFSQSTGFRYGARFGIGQSQFGSKGLADQQGKLSLSGGVSNAYQFNPTVGIGVDALFVSKGTKASGVTTEDSPFNVKTDYKYHETYRLYDAEIPLMLRLGFGSENFFFRVFGGPSFNFNLLSTEERTYDNENYNQDHGYPERELKGVKVLEYAVVLGLGIEAQNAQNKVFFADLRKSSALTSFGKITANGNNGYNEYFSIGLGYRY